MALTENCALVRWNIDGSLSVISISDVQKGKVAVGEKVTALYLRKTYVATILEIGEQIKFFVYYNYGYSLSTYKNQQATG